MNDGFLGIDKPVGITSHDVVALVRRITGVRKVGHAGTLDPIATGLVIVGLGRATRLLRFLTDLDKEYLAEVQFGVATDTLDAAGLVTERRPMAITKEQLVAALPPFLGEIMQVPPMVSAVSIGGRRLYELARQGIEVERPARPVRVDHLEVERFVPGDFPLATMRVVCGKGTYVRTLADDIATALGGRAHLTALRRERIGEMAAGPTPDQLGAGDWHSHLVGSAEGLRHLAAVSVTEAEAARIRSGQPLAHEGDGLLRVLDGEGRLLAVYRGAAGTAVPEVVVA